MGQIDPAEEWTRISSHYRNLTDGELVAIVRQRAGLTSVAQQALDNEVSMRGLTIEPEPEAPPPDPESDDSAYASDRRLVELCKVWSPADAVQVQYLLDVASIPFFMGAEKATGVDAVISDFSKGVTVSVMQIGLPLARQAMYSYEPANDPDPEPIEPFPDAAVMCPKCRSTDIVLVPSNDPEVEEGTPEVFNWVCDACGHEWKDDGTVKET